MSTTADHRPSRGDTVSIIVLMVAGALIAVWTIAQAALRIAEVLRNSDVTIHATFLRTEVPAPIGPDGADLPVTLDSAAITVPTLPSSAMGAAVLEPIVLAGTILTVIACLLLLGRNILRGRIFSRGSTRLVTIAGMVALVGFGVVPALHGVVGATALDALSNGAFSDTPVFEADVFPFLLGAFAFATVSTAFMVGDRLRRDTEGLV